MPPTGDDNRQADLTRRIYDRLTTVLDDFEANSISVMGVTRGMVTNHDFGKRPVGAGMGIIRLSVRDVAQIAAEVATDADA